MAEGVAVKAHEKRGTYGDDERLAEWQLGNETRDRKAPRLASTACWHNFPEGLAKTSLGIGLAVRSTSCCRLHIATTRAAQ